MTTFAPGSLSTETVTISRFTSSTSAAGFPGGDYTTLASGVRAAFVELSGEEAIRFQRLDARYTGKFVLPAGQAITAKDRVAWGTRTFEVLSVIQRRYASGLVSHVEAICAETKGGNN